MFDSEVRWDGCTYWAILTALFSALFLAYTALIDLTHRVSELEAQIEKFEKAND